MTSEQKIEALRVALVVYDKEKEAVEQERRDKDNMGLAYVMINYVRGLEVAGSHLAEEVRKILNP